MARQPRAKKGAAPKKKPLKKARKNEANRTKQPTRKPQPPRHPAAPDAPAKPDKHQRNPAGGAGRKRGGQLTYSRATADRICARIAAGETLRAVCREDGFPPESTVRGWAIDDVDGFSAQYARARELQAWSWADEIIDIAADAGGDFKIETDARGKARVVMDGQAISRCAMQIDSRKWLLARLKRDEFGNSLKLGGNVGLHEKWLDKMDAEA